MSIVLKQEVERLQSVVSADPTDEKAQADLKRMEEALANYKPAEVIGGACVSCEG